MPVSPGVYVNTYQFAAYVARLAQARTCILGGASKGPVNTPTILLNEGELVRKFGIPLLDDYGVQAAAEILRAGGVVLYNRVVDGTEDNASVSIPGTTGGVAAVGALGNIIFTTSTNPLDGESITIDDGTNSVEFEFDDDASFTGDVGVLIGVDAAATMTNLITAIGNSVLTIDAVDATVTVPECDLENTTGGVVGNVAIIETGVAITATGMAGGVDAVPGSVTTLMVISAATPGEWGDEVDVLVEDTNQQGGTGVDITIYAPPVPGGPLEQVEKYENLSLTDGDARFVEDALQYGLVNEVKPSNYISAAVIADGDPDGATYDLAGGANGIAALLSTDYIGTLAGQQATGLKAVLNAETVEYNLITIPGVTHQGVVTALIAHCVARADCEAIQDGPFGLDRDEAVDWHNGDDVVTPNAPATALDTDVMAFFWSWRKVYDAYNQKEIWLPPSGGVLARISQTDRAMGEWWPSAGVVNGLVEGVDVEYSPDQADRDVLLGSNNVNPLVKFPEGITIYGNKTLQRQVGPYQSLSKKRMVLFVSKACATSARYLVFTPTDPVTWAKLRTQCEAVIGPVLALRGLKSFTVVCDASTNDEETQARQEVRARIELVPADIGEKIILDFVTNQSGQSELTLIS